MVSPRSSISLAATFFRILLMIFPLRVLGRPSAHWIFSGVAIGPINVAHMRDEFFLEVIRLLDAGLEGYVGIDGLALDIMGITDNGSLGNLGVSHEGAFHFSRAHPVTGYVDDVVDAARDLIVAVLVPAGAVTGE